jgi:putative ABC transport system permease protein
MLALASGAALGIVTFLLQKQVGTQLLDTSPIPAANLLFLNASTLQRQQLMQLLRDQTNLNLRPEWMPITWMTLVKAGGLDLQQLRAAHPRTWIQKTWLASCADAPPSSSQLVAGHWWPPDSGASAALEEGTAERLGLRVGSPLEFLRDAGPVQVRVTAIMHVPPVQRMWYSIVLGCAAFGKQDPVYYYGGMAVKPADFERVRQSIHSRVPELLTADASDFVHWTEQIGTESAAAVRFCAILVLVAAMSLLLGITRALRFFRIHEVAVLRAIGARPRTVLAAVVLEYAALGALAGLIGVSLGSGATTAVLYFVTGNFRWTFHAEGAVVLIIATALIAGGVGLCGSRTLLDAPPLEVLRRQ